MKSKRIFFRVTDEEYEQIEAEALKNKVPVGALSRSATLEFISGFDREQEHILQRLDHIEDTINDQLKLLIEITTTALGSGATPIDSEKYSGTEMVQKLREHYTSARTRGNNVVQAIKDGKL
jgi:hypothetical protein